MMLHNQQSQTDVFATQATGVALRRMRVPAVMVRVTPAPWDMRPNIEKTTRDQKVAAYEVPLIKASWGARAAKIEVKELKDGQHDAVGAWINLPPPGPGLTPLAAEIKRLTSNGSYGAKVFQSIYPGDAFARVFDMQVEPVPEAEPATAAAAPSPALIPAPAAAPEPARSKAPARAA